MSRLRRAFGQVIRTHRQSLDISQEKLAQRAKVSRNFVGSVERGESSVSLEVAERIGRALGTTLSTIIAEAENL